VTARAQSEVRTVTRLQNNSARPLEGLDGYSSDSGSSIQSRNSDAVPKTPQCKSDSNATEAESNGELSEEQIFDWQSDDSDQHTPAQKTKRHAVQWLARKMTILLGHKIRKASCQNAMSFSSQSGISATSSALSFNESFFRHGTSIMFRKRIMKERLPELWQSLCIIIMRGWKSLRDTMPGLFPIFVSKR
jgi:hypothetical protein